MWSSAIPRKNEHPQKLTEALDDHNPSSNEGKFYVTLEMFTDFSIMNAYDCGWIEETKVGEC